MKKLNGPSPVSSKAHARLSHDRSSDRKGKSVSRVYEETQAEGAETHQMAQGGTALTTQRGVPVADDQNSLKTEARRLTLLEDFHFSGVFHPGRD